MPAYRRFPLTGGILAAALVLLTGCEKTPRFTDWKIETLGKPELSIVLPTGMDRWKLRWKADGSSAFLTFATHSQDYMDGLLVDMNTKSWHRFGTDGVAVSAWFNDHMNELVNGLTPEASGVVQAEAVGEVGYPAQARFQTGSGDKPVVWNHPGQPAFFNGTFTLREKGGTGKIFIRETLRNVAPVEVVEQRVSVDPTGHHVVFVDGSLGGANRVFFFRVQ